MQPQLPLRLVVEKEVRQRPIKPALNEADAVIDNRGHMTIDIEGSFRKPFDPIARQSFEGIKAEESNVRVPVEARYSRNRFATKDAKFKIVEVIAAHNFPGDPRPKGKTIRHPVFEIFKQCR